MVQLYKKALFVKTIIALMVGHTGLKLGLRISDGVYKVMVPKVAPVAQSDRAFDYESKGRVFESRRAHHKPFIPL
jgi:hypothetical protein